MGNRRKGEAAGSSWRLKLVAGGAVQWLAWAGVAGAAGRRRKKKEEEKERKEKEKERKRKRKKKNKIII